MNRKGFTLIELLIVIAILGILAAAVLVAVDPVGRIREARDARRWSESNAVLNAVLNKQVDARALYTGSTVLPVILSDDYDQIIVSEDGGVTTFFCDDLAGDNISCPDANLDETTDDLRCFVNLGSLAPQYIASIPVDPRGTPYSAATNTGYYFRRTSLGRITVGACDAEGSGTISVTR